MKIAESIFVTGKPVGRLIVNTNSREISFQPAEVPSLLSDRSWDSVGQLKQALIRSYSQTKKIPAIKPGFSVPLTEDTNRTSTRGPD